MREIVHRVHAPLVARLVVFNVRNAVNDGVAHIEVRRRHIDFCTQNLCAVRELTRRHTAEQIKILFDTAVAVGAVFARFGERTAIGANLVGG